MKKMKMFVLAFIAIVSITSCSKEDDSPTTEALLTAKWRLSEEGHIYDSGSENFVTWGLCGDDFVQFSNGSAYTEAYTRTNDCTVKAPFTGTWSLVNGKLRFTGSNLFENDVDYEIIELTDKILKIKYTDSVSSTNLVAKTARDPIVVAVVTVFTKF